jgi:WD40 repeat protein
MKIFKTEDFEDYVFSTSISPCKNKIVVSVGSSKFIFNMLDNSREEFKDANCNGIYVSDYQSKIISSTRAEIYIYDYEIRERKIIKGDFFPRVVCSPKIKDKYFIVSVSVEREKLTIYNIDTLEFEYEFTIPVLAYFQPLSWSPTGKYITFFTQSNNLHVWDFHNKKEFRVLSNYDGNILSLSWYEDILAYLHPTLCACKIKLWNIIENKTTDIQVFPGTIRIAFSPDGKKIGCGTGGKIVIYEINSPVNPMIYCDPKQVSMYSISWFPDSKRIVYDGCKDFKILTTCEWNDRNNHFFSKEIREMVFHLMMCFFKNKKKIPIEVWLIVLSFLVETYP